MFFAGRFVLDIATFAERKGVSHTAVIQATGFSKTELASETCLLPYEGIEAVFAEVKAVSDAPDFGLQMGEQINLRATAFLDQLMDSCATVQEAFEHAIRYSKLISDAMICSLEVSEKQFRVIFDLNPNWALKDDYAVIQNLNLALICCKNSLQRLTAQEYFPSEVNLFYPKPKKLSEYMRLFNCHLNFKEPVSSIVFNRMLLGKSARHQNRGLREELERRADEILATLPNEDILLLRVKKSILKNISPASFKIAHVAEDLNMTPRTLQRRLRAENLTFKKVQNDIRLQIVLKLLSDGMHNLDEIAYLVGYSEASVLVRSFKSWTGTTPRKHLAKR